VTGEEHVFFTTPYIVRQPGLSEWQAYFRRNLPVAARLDAYERHMTSLRYWNEYVFEGYAGHDLEDIFLEGVSGGEKPRESDGSAGIGWVR
jgi:hypothetical protein